MLVLKRSTKEGLTTVLTAAIRNGEPRDPNKSAQLLQPLCHPKHPLAVCPLSETRPGYDLQIKHPTETRVAAYLQHDRQPRRILVLHLMHVPEIFFPVDLPPDCSAV